MTVLQLRLRNVITVIAQVTMVAIDPRRSKRSLTESNHDEGELGSGNSGYARARIKLVTTQSRPFVNECSSSCARFNESRLTLK